MYGLAGAAAHRVLLIIAVLGLLGAALWFVLPVANGEFAMNAQEVHNTSERIDLPQPVRESTVSIEEALEKRRSVRDFTQEAVSLEALGQLLWAAQGITSDAGKRTAPSAGATYPLEIYVVVERVDGLDAGIYHYVPDTHALVQSATGRFARDLQEAALDQGFIGEAPINLVVAAEFQRTQNRYGARGERYVYMEAGHATQNVYLQCQSLELEAVVVGAFTDQQVKAVTELPEPQQPLYIMPVGKSDGS